MKALLATLALAGCAPAAPDDPTWLADVRPILAANCIRCHGATPRNDTPTTFRLDVLDDVGDVKGARSMAEFAAARAAKIGDMPPEGAKLSSRQKQILEAWQYTTAAGTRDGDHVPVVTVQVSPGDQPDLAILDVLVTDPEGDLVIGELKADGATVAPLHAGAQRIELDTSGLAPGDRSLIAIVDDGDGAKSVELDPISVAHAGANATPRLELIAPKRDALVPVGGKLQVQLRASDADAGDSLTVDVKAVLDQTEVVVATRVKPQPSGLVEVDFDTTGVAEGAGWTIAATVSDGKAARTVASPPFIVSQPATADTYATVKPIIDNVCGRCHAAHLATGPNFDLVPKLQEFAGRSWRKLTAGEMPPPSMRVVLPQITFSDDDRARLAAWFYAGAPP